MNPSSERQRPFVLHTRVVTGTGGGPEKTILNSPRFLARHGYDSACLFMHPPADEGFASLRSKAERAEASLIEVDDAGPLDLGVLRACLRACRETRTAIWHAHDYKSNAIGLLLRRFHPMRLVTTAHGWVKFTSKTPLYYKIDRFCIKRYERVICVSQDLFDRCRAMGVADERLSLVDNAIIVDDYDPSPATADERARFGIPEGRVVLGAAGRLSEEKGFALLIEAVHRLVADGFDVGLLIAGEGDLKSALRAQIDGLGLADRIALTGFLADPRELYRAIDVFVLSSLREGLPNVVLEAMASQRAVVTTRVNGVPRLVEDGVNGLIVEQESVDELYGGIRKFLESRDFRSALAAAGRETVASRFSFARRMERVVGVYRELNRP